MKQIEMMQRISLMEQGQCLSLTHASLVEAVSGNLDSLLFDYVRDSDIKEFTEKAETNWNAHFMQNPMSGDWTIRKL